MPTYDRYIHMFSRYSVTLVTKDIICLIYKEKCCNRGVSTALQTIFRVIFGTKVRLDKHFNKPLNQCRQVPSGYPHQQNNRLGPQRAYFQPLRRAPHGVWPAKVRHWMNTPANCRCNALSGRPISGTRYLCDPS